MRLLVCSILICFFPVSMWAVSRSALVANVSSPVIQNTYADNDHLSRMRDVAMVRRFVKHGYLVRVRSSTRYWYLHAIPAANHYCRPWTRLFLERLGRQFHAKFGHRLRVTSLVRTVASQISLSHRNGNAANAFGPLRSSHLTGATVDISKHSMSAVEQRWVRNVLYSLRKQGYLYAIEEFQQPTFHVMVYRDYLDYVARLTGKR
jgi:hypothetical protein